jgi:hypothetical protein
MKQDHTEHAMEQYVKQTRKLFCKYKASTTTIKYQDSNEYISFDSPLPTKLKKYTFQMKYHPKCTALISNYTKQIARN